MSIKENLENKLYELDKAMNEYRKNKDIPGTPEYEAEQRANELLSTPHRLFDRSEDQEDS